MSTFAGFDVSQAKTHISVVDDQGKELWHGSVTTSPDASARSSRPLYLCTDGYAKGFLIDFQRFIHAVCPSKAVTGCLWGIETSRKAVRHLNTGRKQEFCSSAMLFHDMRARILDPGVAERCRKTLPPMSWEAVAHVQSLAA